MEAILCLASSIAKRISGLSRSGVSLDQGIGKHSSMKGLVGHLAAALEGLTWRRIRKAHVILTFFPLQE
jgi:hypothetical protein